MGRACGGHGLKRNAHRVLMGRLEGKEKLGRHRSG